MPNKCLPFWGVIFKLLSPLKTLSDMFSSITKRFVLLTFLKMLPHCGAKTQKHVFAKPLGNPSSFYLIFGPIL